MEQSPIQLGVIDLILQAGPLVKLVMFILLGMSVGSWMIIFFKNKILNLADKQNENFMNGFTSKWDLDEAFLKASDYPLSPVAKSFQSVIQELRKVAGNKNIKGGALQEITIRSLRKANATEMSSLEYSLSWLASTASAAPFIGLFGTVWGIMSSFQSIGATGNANLAAVAPGISEALIATAIGLAAAIPAAIAYNFLLGKVRLQGVSLETFSQDLLNTLQREEFFQ